MLALLATALLPLGVPPTSEEIRLALQRPTPIVAARPEADSGGFVHHHVSARGTPQVHGFFTEPAFLGRDVLATWARRGDEREVEVEVEWALSRRTLVVAGLPYEWTSGEDGAAGPVEMAFRALLVERPRWLLSVQVGVGMPLNTAQGVTLEGSALAWVDLGGDVTLQASAALEFDVEEDAWAVPYAATLAWTTPLRSPFARRACGNPAHAHGAEPRLTLLAELSGNAPLAGDEGPEVEALLGATLPVTGEVEVRGGWLHLLEGEREEKDGVVLGLVVHL